MPAPLRWLGDTLRALFGAHRAAAPPRGGRGRGRGATRTRAGGAAPPRRADANRTQGTTPSPERTALLEEALRIHRRKRVLLDHLEEEDQFLLRVMAHQLLVEGSPAQADRSGAPKTSGPRPPRPTPPPPARRHGAPD
ncbi:hypothetical protein GGD88_000550 [Roseospira goensis]|uniref:Uncharacterized protein n=1 Tax=Roseospira goensis TaxID=391922 RepID=A0A7W6RX29_9PROT|nr:hypothetical protein [Roseospira goensis]